MTTKNIINALEDQMCINSNKIAVKYYNDKYTYNTLDHITYRIAAHLQKNSIGPDNIVALYMERSWLSVCATIGVLRAGAAFLPIDKKIPIDRVSEMIRISRAKLIICDIDYLINIDSTIINIDQIISNDQNKYELKLHYNNSSLAYVIFTSGSTGTPKGVMIEHAGMNNHIAEKIKLLNINENSIVAHNASISFDISVWQVLAPLCIGGTLVIFPEESVLKINKFKEILYRERVTILEVVPTYMNLLINECSKESINLTYLKYLMSTGQELTLTLVERWLLLFPSIPIVNAYGPTETSDDITHCIISDASQYERIPIGLPINGADLYVMDEYEKECSTGQIGELWVSGICVGRGYIGNNEETKKYFFMDNRTRKRLYKTGDLVSRLNDGNYLYHGRIDTQIKIFGNRIEIKEIENIIMIYKDIKEVTVIFDKDKECLVAVYTSFSNIDTLQLKNFLYNKLPDYMIPSLYLNVDDIPININGKIDYEKINELIANKWNNNYEKEAIYEVKSNNEKEEESIKNMILKIIDIDKFPNDDSWKNDMTLIGFNSISAIRLIVAIEEMYEFEFGDEYLLPEVLFNFNKIIDYVKTQQGIIK